MTTPQGDKCFFASVAAHAFLLFVFIVGFDYVAPLPVLENTQKNDVISAVILGDSPDSKILPQKIAQPVPAPQPVKPEPVKAEPLKQEPKKVAVKPDAIALAKKMQHELLAKDLLQDIKKLNAKQKNIKQAQKKQMQAQFQKTLQEQAEKSLRQQLLKEDIKLRGTQSRQAQGVVDKYKALILQAISEHWVVPTQANKKLYSELMIRVAPGGMVLDVQITKSSGDPALDSSARAAVLKSSPLPVPSDPAAFEPFRQFVLKVKPENIIADSSGLMS
jgi:colicin import membrane protein